MDAGGQGELTRRAPGGALDHHAWRTSSENSLEVQTLLIFPYSDLTSPLSSESEKHILYIFLRAASGRLGRQIAFFLFCS
jgi:hypothetical protein